MPNHSYTPNIMGAEVRISFDQNKSVQRDRNRRPSPKGHSNSTNDQDIPTECGLNMVDKFLYEGLFAQLS